jgi:phage gp36-like protein
LDKDNHRIASIEVNVDREVLVKELTQMGDKKEQKLRLPFLVDHPKNVFSYLMNRYEGSLSKISKFIQYCHENHLCQLTYTLLRDYINLKYSIEGQLAVLCSIDENYLNGLSEKDFANDFGSMMQELAVKDKKQFRKDVNLLHNIIRVDICGAAPEQEIHKEGGADEAIQKGEKTVPATDKDGSQ